MKFQASGTERPQPRIVAERAPLRPVSIEAIRKPIKVTKPFSLGEVARSVAVPPARPPR